MSGDAELKQSVLAELEWDPRVAAAHIGVIAAAGIVTLTGHVENYAAKKAAENAVGRVAGVKAIVEELEVRVPGLVQHHDDEIAAAALERLDWNVSVPKGAVKVVIDKGWVTLTGEVYWYFQKLSALRDIHDLAGVVGLSDRIAIRPRLNAASLGDDIALALHRSWHTPKTVTVWADGGKITLGGTARSWRDRAQAEATAWAAPGATSVENNIAIR